VDWNSDSSQVTRFTQLLRVCDFSGPIRLGDYGCGYGGLFGFLCARAFDGQFAGYDIAPAMVEAARALYAADGRAVFSDDEAVLDGSDFVVCSGVFNVKLKAPLAEWETHVLHTIERLQALSRRGFAFNCLTSYSDPERMRPDLYYPDPCRLFDHCKRRYSRHVALLHDYGLYEFTILVRK
jgi:SAM-dependent methyltransferase